MGIATFLLCSAIIAILVICYGWVAGALALLAMGMLFIWTIEGIARVIAPSQR